MNVSLTAADLRTVGLTKADPVQSSLATVRPNIGPGPPCSCLLAVLLVTFWKVYFATFMGTPATSIQLAATAKSLNAANLARRISDSAALGEVTPSTVPGRGHDKSWHSHRDGCNGLNGCTPRFIGMPLNRCLVELRQFILSGN